MPGSRLTPASGATRATAVAVAALLAIAILALVPGRALAIAPPQLSSRAAILVDADSGQTLFGQNPNGRRAIASTTKLMTALITLEHVHHLGRMFTQNDYVSATEDSQIGLVPGERMSVHDLMLAMLLPSADDAAEDLAYNVGRGSVARFVGMMNAKARELDLTHTHYSTPIGLDTPGNYSSASDLAKLARYVTRELAVLPARGGAPQRGAAYRPARPRGRQPQRPRRPLPLDQRRQDRPHQRGRLRARGLGHQRRDDADQRSARNAVESRRATTARWRCWTGVSTLPACARRCTPDRCWRAPRSRAARECTRAVVADLTYSHVFEKGAHVHLIVTAPQQLTGRCSATPSSARSR